MNHRNTRLLLSLAVLSALAACGGQESKEQKPASAPTEASAVQTTPEAASTASAASQTAVDSNASPEDQELLKRAEYFQTAAECRRNAETAPVYRRTGQTRPSIMV